MVNVLFRGTPPGETIHYVTCRFCRSKLQFKRKEASYTSDRDGEYLSIVCPVCEGNVTADAKLSLNSRGYLQGNSSSEDYHG